MKKILRRDLLRQTAVAAGTAMTFGIVPAAEILGAAKCVFAVPSVKFPVSARERLAVASWPFRAYIDSPTNKNRDMKQEGMSLMEFATRVKHDFQVQGVEPLSAHFLSTDERYLNNFREAIEKAGVHVVNIPVDNRSSFYDADPAGRQKAVDNSKKWINVAAVMGSPSVRLSIAETRNAKPDVDMVAEQLKQLADYGALNNIIVNLENDNLVSEDAFFLVKVIEKVNHPYLRALPDFCNSMGSRNEKFNYDAMTALFPLAYNICHVKDSEMDDEGKVFQVDLKKTFGILKASGYRGYCSMEWEGEGSSYDGTRMLIKAALENLG
jgi:sugar phosphate isomerase/epimerase